MDDKVTNELIFETLKRMREESNSRFDRVETRLNRLTDEFQNFRDRLDNQHREITHFMLLISKQISASIKWKSGYRPTKPNIN